MPSATRLKKLLGHLGCDLRAKKHCAHRNYLNLLFQYNYFSTIIYYGTDQYLLLLYECLPSTRSEKTSGTHFGDMHAKGHYVKSSK